ncbi:MAG: hypothetical protein K2J30_03445, partial [Clostridia bacterium]|nr:hypothetical protein [Clostridia bacterium]
GKIAVAAFALAIGAGACGAFLPKTHAAFAESETQATVPASTEEQLEQTPRAEGDVVVAAPQMVGDTSVTYDGKSHTFVIKGVVVATYMSTDFEHCPTLVAESGDTYVFEATEASTYWAEFELGDGYAWAPDTKLDENNNKKAIVEFSITRATDQKVYLDKEYCFAYGEEINVAPTTKYPLSAADNAITISYYTYSGNANNPQGGAAVPKNAGVYYVEVKVAETTNYNGVKAGAVIVIEKKELKVSATMHVSYGQRVTKDDIDIESITGFAYGETADSCVSIRYDILAQGMKYGEGTTSATVGKYIPNFAMENVTVNAYTAKTASSIYGFYKKDTAYADNYY